MTSVIYAVNSGEVLMCDEGNGGDPQIKILSNFICVTTHSNKTFQEVTHLDTILTKARLTTEFWCVYGYHDFKTRCVKRNENIYIYI